MTFVLGSSYSCMLLKKKKEKNYVHPNTKTPEDVLAIN
jgi:hypothetical protein